MIQNSNLEFDSRKTFSSVIHKGKATGASGAVMFVYDIWRMSRPWFKSRRSERKGPFGQGVGRGGARGGQIYGPRYFLVCDTRAAQRQYH